eukprot:TRINITY_DN22214_c0_g1_i1.p3 TRINITY_DN22214_c0_g1~~TRINITY_DN22214_c0_g1_i1.p3  ORF type:complete len:174 (+),score=99.26 TRINITY_DN22214_c0_g1_i1:143-664(+)
MSGKKGGKAKDKSEDEIKADMDNVLEDLGKDVWSLERRLVIEAEKYQRYKLIQLDLKREIAQLGEQMEYEEKLTQATRHDMYKQYKAMQQELSHRIDIMQQTIDSLREDLEQQRQGLETTKHQKDEVIAQKNKKINEQKQQMENMAIVFGNMLKETLEKMSQRMDGQGSGRQK